MAVELGGEIQAEPPVACGRRGDGHRCYRSGHRQDHALSLGAGLATRLSFESVWMRNFLVVLSK